MNKTYFLVIDEDCTPAIYPAEQCKCKEPCPPVTPVPPIGTLPETLGTGIVRTNGSNLNLRREPSLDSEVIARMPNGSRVLILDRDANPGWFKVEHENHHGYAASQWIEMQR